MVCRFLVMASLRFVQTKYSTITTSCTTPSLITLTVLFIFFILCCIFWRLVYKFLQNSFFWTDVEICKFNPTWIAQSHVRLHIQIDVLLINHILFSCMINMLILNNILEIDTGCDTRNVSYNRFDYNPRRSIDIKRQLCAQHLRLLPQTQLHSLSVRFLLLSVYPHPKPPTPRSVPCSLTWTLHIHLRFPWRPSRQQSSALVFVVTLANKAVRQCRLRCKRHECVSLRLSRRQCPCCAAYFDVVVVVVVVVQVVRGCCWFHRTSDFVASFQDAGKSRHIWRWPAMARACCGWRHWACAASSGSHSWDRVRCRSTWRSVACVCASALQTSRLRQSFRAQSSDRCCTNTTKKKDIAFISLRLTTCIACSRFVDPVLLITVDFNYNPKKKEPTISLSFLWKQIITEASIERTTGGGMGS